MKSEIDPQLLIAMAAKACKRAELLWEPQPESSPNISPAAPPPPDLLANQLQVKVSKFDQTLHVQDLVDKNARGIKHMEMDMKITLKDTPSSDSGGGEASLSGGCGNVEVNNAHKPAEPLVANVNCRNKVKIVVVSCKMKIQVSNRNNCIYKLNPLKKTIDRVW